MNLLEELSQKLRVYQLLDHRVYQDVSNGKLNLCSLRKYVKQYYHHVATFPRYISILHAQCDILETRQKLLNHLVEEEQGRHNHPELWLRFSESIDIKREEIKKEELLNNTKLLINGYFDICQDSFASGLGAIYAYEQQNAIVMQALLTGLQKFYGFNKDQLHYFIVHVEADKIHAIECEQMIQHLDQSLHSYVHEGAVKAAKLLWQFLDGIQEYNLSLN